MSNADRRVTMRDRVISKMATAFNRADELGGELRDYLTERYEQSEGAHKLSARLASLRPKKKTIPVRQRGSASKAEVAADVAVEAAVEQTQELEQEGLGNPNLAAQIFGRDSCPWTGRAIKLLEDNKIDYDYIDLDVVNDESLDNNLVAETKQNTVPYVFLGGQFVGGYNATAEIARLGQLQYAIIPPQLRANDPEASNVVIAARPNTDED